MRSLPAVQNLLVVVPNWVGDVVLATPVFAALRAHFGDARITFLGRGYVAEILEGCGWHDEWVNWPAKGGAARNGGPHTTFELVGRLRAGAFDTTLLLTNSFRSAVVTAAARIPRRIGYAREARGLLLTDRLRPLKRDGEFVPAPMTDYYAAIAERAGCRVDDRKLRLGISAPQAEAAQQLQRHYGLQPGKYAVINPGAAFGAAKCWLPERFAQICDHLNGENGLTPVVVGAGGEAPLMKSIAAQCQRPAVCCLDPGTALGSLKGLVRDAALLVCNDTGPRHYGNAFNVPTVTIFGPTHQAWTHTGYEREIPLQIEVPCGPCMLRTCPIDHRCMTGVTVDMVMDASRRMLKLTPVATISEMAGA